MGLFIGGLLGIDWLYVIDMGLDLVIVERE